MISAPCRQIGPAVITPVFLLRVSGLPLAYTDALGNSPVRAAIARARGLEQAIAGDAQTLSNALHAAVANATGKPALQNSLLNLRRAVFNGRIVGADSIARVASDLPGAVLDTLQRWHQLRAELEQHEHAAEQLVAEALPQVRRALKRALADEHFRKGLAIVNPAFERTLDAYLRADERQCNRKLRQTERTALLYLMRTVHKTSPLSTLTMVSMGSFDSGTAMEPRWLSWQQHQRARPNVGTLSRIAQALSATAVRHPGLRLSLQEGIQREHDRVHYRQRRETPIQVSGPMHSTVSEASFSLHLSSSLDYLLDYLQEHGACTVRQLIALLRTQLGMVEEQAATFLQRLVDQGLLAVDGLRQTMFEPDGWARFCAELEASGEPALCSAGEALRGAQHAVERFAAAQTDERRELLRSVNASLGQAFTLAGAAGEPPQPALYEDASPSKHLVATSATAWRGVVEQLGELQRLLGLLDPMLISRATLRSLFLKRFGAGGICEDLIGFSNFFQDSFYRSMSAAAWGGVAGSAFGTGTLNPLSLQEVSAIQEAQAELIGAVEAAAYSRNDGQGDIVLTEELVERLGAKALGWQRWMSNAFFVQPVRRSSEASLVLNRIYGGAGCTFGRFTHLYDDTYDEPARALLQSSLDALKGRDMLFAELQGGHETNLNLRPLLAQCELVLPGERASTGPAQRIALSDLSIRHDVNRDMLYLYCHRLGKRIVPLYLGMLYPLILPELQTLLLHFAPPALLHTDALDRTPAADERITFKPRVRYRQVYLERARWVVPASLLPRRADKESDYRYLRRLTEWRIAEGMPSQMFVKLLGTSAMRPASEKTGGFGFGGKPVYIDFDQPLSAALFAYLIQEVEGHVLLSERLPGSEDALSSPDGNTYTHEYVFELAQGTF